MSVKGIIKYLVYICIAGWMFFLGILVGRGNSPVTFDTQKFQKRLETIANEFNSKKEILGKIDLKFYDVLDRPAADEEDPSEMKPEEPVLKQETIDTRDGVPLKTSLKKKAVNNPENRAGTGKESEKTVKGESLGQVGAKPSDPGTLPEKSTATLVLKGDYTIQIAAYKDFKDAITQMAVLEEKGFKTYRVRGEKDGVTWYRVRIGPFETHEAAKQYIEKLNKAKIDAMIIKRDNDEDIKG